MEKNILDFMKAFSIAIFLIPIEFLEIRVFNFSATCYVCCFYDTTTVGNSQPTASAASVQTSGLYSMNQFQKSCISCIMMVTSWLVPSVSPTHYFQYWLLFFVIIL
jgi:hypothetical protein